MGNVMPQLRYDVVYVDNSALSDEHTILITKSDNILISLKGNEDL